MSDLGYSGDSNKVSTSLHMAIKNGDAVTDNDIRKENINTKDRDGMLPIHVACMVGSSVMVKKLFNHGASINSLTQLKYRPLHLAVEKGHEEVIELLLREGADINANDNYEKFTPLHIAVKAGLLKTVKQLLGRGASVSVTDVSTNTVLHIAVEKEFVEIVEILLNHNANVHAEGQSDSTPLHFSDNVKISKMLLDKGADINAKNCWKETPLHKRKSTEATKFLLEYDEVDVNSVSRFDGQTALFGCTDETIVRMMLEKGADVDVRNRFGRTVLHENVQMNRVKIVELLLDYEADVTMQDIDGVTPLHLSRNETISRMLISKGANANAKSRAGMSPIHYAAAEGCNELVKVLLEYGVDINCKDWRGMTPLCYAAEGNRYYDITEILLNNGADVNDDRRNGFSLLHSAIQRSSTDVTSLLLQYNANVDDRVVFEIDGIREFNGPFPRPMSWAKADCISAIEKHFISLKALEPGRKYPNLPWKEFNAEETRRFYDSCKNQADLMTQEKIGNTRVSFRNILTRSIHRVATYASNKSIVEAVELGEYKEKYPVYAKRVETKFKIAQKLANQRSLISLDGSLFSIISYNLPDIVIEKILSYLSYRDLRLLIQASSNATNE